MENDIKSIDASTEWFVAPHSSDEVLPRVGDQYQAEIPTLVMDYDHLTRIDGPDDMAMGLPIPIMWIQDARNIKKQALVDGNQDDGFIANGTADSEYSEESKITSNNEDVELRAETWCSALPDTEELGGLSQNKKKLDRADNGRCPVPGSPLDSWRDIEHDSYLLGLYIFGKKLHFVKKFVESKGMGDILSYYYGKFYRSSDYLRWSECRKMKSRRWIHGQKIFTGGRQQQLFLRLISRASEECKNMLTGVFRTYGEGKLSLEEFVFNLRDLVGTQMLVEAVAIGKGKKDLTGTATEHVKTSHVLRARAEMPVGKACSSLTSSEIIKFLTGNYRLSKARSSDLFWEAVWPRLLAKGWHSEQPTDRVSAGSKHSLVFLVPGVKKYSRRRLVKGNHYFDCVTDVLNKVASEPGLLELEVEAATTSSHGEECRSDPRMNQDADASSKKKRHFYLQPRNSSCIRDAVTFTVVDTSLIDGGGGGAKVRELRTLPADLENVSTVSALSNSTAERDSSQESRYKIIENITSSPVDNVTESQQFADSTDRVTIYNPLPNGLDPKLAEVESRKDQRTSIFNDRLPRKSKYSLPFNEQCQAIAYSQRESSHSVESISLSTKRKEEDSCCLPNTPDTFHDMTFQEGPYQKFSTNFLAGSTEESSKGTLNAVRMDTELLPEKTRPQTWIDLNLPPDPTDEWVHNNDDSSATKSDILSEACHRPEFSNPSNAEPSTEQQAAVNGRRQSTRNRPPTTKALEALAFGYLSPKKKRKGAEALSETNPMSRSSRRVRGRSAGSHNAASGEIDEVVGDL